MEHKPKYPRGNLFIKYNLPFRIWFCWIDPLICYGVRHTLQHEDLYARPPEADSQYLLDKFNKYWQTELDRYNKGGTPRMWRALAKVLWWRILAHGILALIMAMFLVVQSILLGYITDYFSIVSPTSTETRNVYLLATGMAVLTLIVITINGSTAYFGLKSSMLVRITCTSVIYQKLLTLSQRTINKVTTGKIINLSSNDVHRFDLSMLFYQFFWVGPIHLCVVTYFIYQEIGLVSFLAAFLIIIQIPLQVFLGKKFSNLRSKAALKTDERVKIMNEVIIGIRVIKMYGWEYAFHRLISYLRKKEVSIILKSSVIRAINLSYYSISLPTIMFVVFSIYGYSNGFCCLTPKRVFTTLSLLYFVRLTSITFLLKGIIQVSEANVALKRISEFLLLDELNAEKPYLEVQSNRNTVTVELSNIDDSRIPNITVNNMSASWSDEPNVMSLRNISFSVNKQESPLLAVVGSVGSGKSMLLQCLLKELPVSNGSLSISGRVGYAAQEPWIFSASLRENILFGLPFEQDWYDKVIESCTLDRDIEILPNGDLTVIGERGVTLSGGQKSRVSLARAVYSKADIYLLDDPLSAVDAAVSRHIFDRCIRSLLCENSIVVLVTHQLQYIPQCDNVLGLRDGNVMFCCDPSEILESIEFTSIIKNNEETKHQEDERSQFIVRKNSLISAITPIKDRQNVLPAVFEEKEIEEDEPNDVTFVDELIDDRQSAFSVPALTSQFSNEGNPQTPGKNVQNNTPKVNQLSREDRVQGTVGIKTYYRYFVAGGGHVFSLFVILSFLVGEGTVVSSDAVLSLLTSCSCGGMSNNCTCCDFSNNSICHLGFGGVTAIYGALVSSVWLTCIGRTILFYVLCLRAARILHNRMFKSVIHAPVLFFDSNPSGRVLNRFSKDIGFLDDILIFAFCEFLQLFTRFLGIMSTAVASNPYLIIVVVLLIIVFGLFRWYYLQSAREIKRLEALARSPLYSHVTMTVQGLSTIRAYQKQGDAQKQFHVFHNRHTQGWDAYLTTTRWLGYRIDGMSSCFVIAMFFLSISLVDVLDLSPPLIGLALTYSLSLSGMFQYCIRQSAEVENYMVSTERVLSYCKLQSERSLETIPPTDKPELQWPEKGHIEVSDLQYRYSKDTPLVLKGLNFVVKAGEKVGIVGRTGAGKSSLISAFFRLAEPEGSIKIDGVECLTLGLHDVRTKIGIIPQDPVLFSGSIRYNLDPFDCYDDENIWKVLKQVQLFTLIESLDGGLDALVTEGGGNFSVGQRQLFCLARALLKNNTILMLDEATANVDLETDAIIQEVIREQFVDCTVLTIAHRLDTVMDSDKIMVLRFGEIMEYDEPYVLLSNPQSYLLRLVDHSGVLAAEKLKAMAFNAYRTKRE